MIRLTTNDDVTDLIVLAEASGLFEPSQTKPKNSSSCRLEPIVHLPKGYWWLSRVMTTHMGRLCGGVMNDELQYF
jgi:hypothetical protein